MGVMRIAARGTTVGLAPILATFGEDTKKPGRGSTSPGLCC